MTYRVVCKCRLCDKEFTPDGYSADNMTNDIPISVFLWRICSQDKTSGLPYHHTCDNGDIGFGDLLGVRKVEK